MGRKRRRRSSLPVTSTTIGSIQPATFVVNGIDIYDPHVDLTELRVKLGAPQQIMAGTSSTPPVEKPPLKSLEKWKKIFQGNLHRFPQVVRSTMSIRQSGFTIDDVYEDGTIVGRYVDQQSTYKLYAWDQDPPAGCSCQRSDGTYACTHCFAFTMRILEDLNKDSELVRRIKAREFATAPFNRKLVRFDRTIDSLNQLRRFIDMKPGLTDTELPPITTTKRERVAWHLHLSIGDSPRISPVVQPMNKRGDAWNKGRPTSVIQISRSVERQAGDVQVLKLYESEYGISISYKLAEALLSLIGQDNVYVDGEPIEIIAGSACLKLVEDKQGWSVQPDHDCDEFTPLEHHFASDGVLSFDDGDMQLYVAQTSTVQARCMQELCALPKVSRPEHVELLHERCRQLQHMVSIALPKEFGPALVNEVKPVMLLRTRTDGFVDYGIRVRDVQGQLHLPGVGLQLTSGTHNDKPVQWKRSFANEHALARKLQQQLELGSSQIEAKLSFEQGLRLLELLERKADEIEVLWDKASEAPIRSLGTISNKNVRVSIQQKRDWFQLNGQCELEGGNIQLSEILDTLSSETQQSVGGYVRIGDRGWAKITEELKEGLQKLADSVNHERGQMKFDRTAAMAMRDLQGELQIDATRPWQACLDRLAKAEALEPEVPKALQAELRDYQAAGFKWLRRLAEWGVGGVLADDMGLGKTVQTLAVLVDRASLGPTLVIAPTSVGFNWLREIARFAPHLKAHSYRETDRSEFFQELGPEHIVVCSYGLALRDIDKLKKITWSSLVLDEAQAIKNSQSKTAQAIAEIEADWKVALTGTPVENHLGELWSLFRIISPGLFGGWEQFRKRFASPIERNHDDTRRLALRDRLKPFVLRRTKKEVLKDLPARTESNLIVELNDQERKLYDKYRLSIVSQASEIAKLPDIKDQRFRLLALLTRLRQIACHPRLVEETWQDRSTKLQQLCETLHELRDEGHRTLIFSQFVQHLHLIREMLDAEKITYQYLDGSTTPAQRQEQVDEFQNGDATAFLISLKAGGTGLNLTAADYVIHMDPWWNPAVEDQATDRAHRIGQTKPVMVYRLIAKNTVEEEILKLHEDKRDLVAGILDGTHAAGSLSTQELIALLTK